MRIIRKRRENWKQMFGQADAECSSLLRQVSDLSDRLEKMEKRFDSILYLLLKKEGVQ